MRFAAQGRSYEHFDVRRRETNMFCGNNMGSLWIIIILILLFGCGGFGCGCNECGGGNNCGCGC